MHRITPFLWFDNQAEEAMNLYVSIFANSEVLNVARAGADGPVISATFRLDGQDVMALNAGPMYQFTEAISFFVNCKDQDEVDYFWEKLIEGGGEPGRCGWLKDKFGLSWQIIPTALGELMQDEDPARANRVVQAMLQMSKIEVAGLQAAHDNG